jgi:ketosteroid isomerase-like protein
MLPVVVSDELSDTRNEFARAFLIAMQECVRAVDYARARPLFADDVVAFGTFAAVVEGRDRLEHEQWRNVWPNIRDFSFRLDELHCLGTEFWICVIVPWESIGQRADGASFSRPGRATLVLKALANLGDSSEIVGGKLKLGIDSTRSVDEPGHPCDAGYSAEVVELQ